MGLFHRPRKVDDRQEHKDHGLDKTHQNAQKEDRQRGQCKAREGKEDPEDFLLTEDIPEEPNAEGHDTSEMTDQLDNKHQRGQDPDGAEEVLDILGAVEFDTDNMRQDERTQRQGQRRIQICRRREKAGD